ncbi:MAG: type III-A CRISPR-associated RAMP protein Csm3 [Chitinophagales bacterium]|jgi:CRISPR-associated protein Csm3|nr:type III-A CRISPR-associated RAMP protein Csm3 [Chitinophagales bacterium]
MPNKKLSKKIFITGKIRTLTGLHIGGTNNSVDIGNVDAYVIRDAYSGKPYIPGSSLRGKLRSLLEQVLGIYNSNANMGKVKNGPSIDGKTITVKLFGAIKSESEGGNIPSKILVRDCPLLSEYRDNPNLPQYTEIKTEVVIDRLTSEAMPRSLERVPAGVEFDLQIVLNVWEEDKEDDMLQHLFMAMLLLQDDYLGGKGSRGCGQIEIGIGNIEARDAAFYRNVGNIDNDAKQQTNHIIPEKLRLWED